MDAMEALLIVYRAVPSPHADLHSLLPCCVHMGRCIPHEFSNFILRLDYILMYRKVFIES